ncbi:antimicrobial peptide ABC transporter permease protein [Ligilactobacillus salitolerans]|uniref:Antimicrobial peptide ABC transporter permease protein n=1 Tax=Ligilactobacillus salitolerans TaxID=1808352 RepID=A0A401IQ51_9LACO|nr:FtsX-like permease family protein [Ligilactobacillus salitolerans]GBG93667.1 antimicrobial peptide ABC transporter permease protein [Ligilactobacillus salitolerans]
MLRKLAFTGIKSRIRDYLVLFTGLVISSAVFYMFEAIATNPEFLKSSTNGMSLVSFIFQTGSVLLTLISLVYIFYANSFLLSMRQHDYGMFLVLGARPKKIGSLILAETLVIGLISSVIGIVIGVGLTGTLGGYLMELVLQDKLAHFQSLYLPAVFITLVLYMVLFIIAGLLNRRKLIKTPVLALLKGEREPNRPRLKPISAAIQIILGLGLLASGYFAMAKLTKLREIGIFFALVVIVLGSYFLFNAVFVGAVILLKKTKWAGRGLNNFTLSQLSFRIRNYTKILATVSLLFALALGAITVGMGFGKKTEMFSQGASAYTMALRDPSAAVKKQVKALDLEQQASYTQKKVKNTLYFEKEEFDQNPLQDVPDNWFDRAAHGKVQKISFQKLNGSQLQKNPGALYSIAQENFDQEIKLVSTSKFNALQAPRQEFYLFRVKDIQKAQPQLEKIVRTLYPKKHQQMRTMIPGGYASYLQAKQMFGGFEFMGFFLGIAFLAMLASCLMFKILSGANSDRQRYEMLNKLGVRPRVLRQSISREIMTLYALPGVLGIAHVLFGLQMFKPLLITPYQGIWLPFTIFIILYLLYFWVTVKLYEHIVLPKVEINR